MRNYLIILMSCGMLLSCQQPAGEGTEEEKTGQEEAQSGEAEQQQQPRQRSSRAPIDSINRIIEEKGQSASLLADRARYHLAYQNMDAARSDIYGVVKLDSSLAEGHELLGEYHFRLNHSRQAKEEWQLCLKLDPENSACLTKLAELMIAVKNYEKALDLVNRQLKVDDSDPQAYFMKGIIVRDRYTDTALALQYFQNAIDLKQNYMEAIDMMAVTLTQQGDSLAKFYYDQLLELQPNNPDIYFKMGVFYQNQGEVNRALESYTKATQLDPGDADSYYNLAYMHLELDQYKQAREYFTKSIQSKERNYKAYHGLGYTFEVVGDLMNAKKNYEKAIEILPMYTPASQALGRVNRELNQAQAQ